MHLRSSVVKVCPGNYVMKVDVTFTGHRSLKGRGHPGSNRRPLHLKSKALPLSYIPVQASPWLLKNSKHPLFPIFFLFFFVLVAALQQALTISYCIGGSVVGFSPATRETGVQFPTMHLRSSVVKVCHANYVMKFEVTFTGCRSLKGRGHPGFNRRPCDLQSKALPLSSILVQVAPWLL